MSSGATLKWLSTHFECCDDVVEVGRDDLDFCIISSISAVLWCSSDLSSSSSLEPDSKLSEWWSSLSLWSGCWSSTLSSFDKGLGGTGGGGLELIWRVNVGAGVFGSWKVSLSDSSELEFFTTESWLCVLMLWMFVASLILQATASCSSSSFTSSSHQLQFVWTLPSFKCSNRNSRKREKSRNVVYFSDFKFGIDMKEIRKRLKYLVPCSKYFRYTIPLTQALNVREFAAFAIANWWRRGW